MKENWTTLISGVVGSHAYGLATPESDVDRLVFAAAPTEAFHGLTPPSGKTASRVSKDPDVTVHEIGKAVGLLLKCNPTVTELLWLDEWEEVHELGKMLIARNSAFLSAPCIRAAYLGYATSQFHKLIRNQENADSVVESRRHKAKNARHLMRLVNQGVQLYTTGLLRIRCDDPEMIFDFGRNAAEDPSIAKPFLDQAHEVFAHAKTPLPEKPNIEFAEAYLQEVRAHFFIDALEAE